MSDRLSFPVAVLFTLTLSFSVFAEDRVATQDEETEEEVDLAEKVLNDFDSRKLTGSLKGAYKPQNGESSFFRIYTTGRYDIESIKGKEIDAAEEKAPEPLVVKEVRFVKAGENLAQLDSRAASLMRRYQRRFGDYGFVTTVSGRVFRLDSFSGTKNFFGVEIFTYPETKSEDGEETPLSMGVQLDQLPSRSYESSKVRVGFIRPEWLEEAREEFAEEGFVLFCYFVCNVFDDGGTTYRPLYYHDWVHNYSVQLTEKK